MTETKPGFMAQLKSYPAAFWVANTMEIFERMAWYGFYAVSSLYITGPVETGALGFTSEERGQIQAIVPFFLYLMPVLTGALADRYGYKKMFTIAYIAMIAAYYALGQFNSFLGFTLAFMFVAVGAAIFKPVVVGTVARVTDESNSSTAFGIFYMMVNIGGFFGPIVAGVVRGWDWKWVFVACASWAFVNLVIVTVLYREPTSEAGSGQARTLRKVLDDTVEVLGNLRFFITVFVSLIALMVANQEFDWFTWKHCLIFVPSWIVLNFLYDALLPGGSGKPVRLGGVIRHPLMKRMYCSNWRFALFLLIMSGFWTSFNQIFLTMPEYIRDFSESKPMVDTARAGFRALGKAEWARHLASVDENEFFAEVDRLVRQARGLESIVPPKEETKDQKKLASELRASLKGIRETAKELVSSRFLDAGQRTEVRAVVRDLMAVDRRSVESMKTAKKQLGSRMAALGRAKRLAEMNADSYFTAEVRSQLESQVRALNTPNAEEPLEVLDIVEGAKTVLGYKVRLNPVEFGELLTLVPETARTPTPETLTFSVERLNKRLHNVRQTPFSESDVNSVAAGLARLVSESGPLPSRSAVRALCDTLTTAERKVEPEQLAPAVHAAAYRDALNDKIDLRRQFNPEFVVNINALGIVLFQVLVSFLMARFHRFTTMIVGMAIAAVGIGLSTFAGDNGFYGAGGSIWIVAGGIFIFSFGEMMASPTSQEYVGRIAPRDKTALYMGYYFVAVALGNLFGGILSGQLYGKLARDLQRPDLMWLCFGGIMLGTAIVFMLYNKLALPKHAAGTLTNTE